MPHVDRFTVHRLAPFTLVCTLFGRSSPCCLPASARPMPPGSPSRSRSSPATLRARSRSPSGRSRTTTCSPTTWPTCSSSTTRSPAAAGGPPRRRARRPAGERIPGAGRQELRDARHQEPQMIATRRDVGCHVQRLLSPRPPGEPANRGAEPSVSTEMPPSGTLSRSRPRATTGSSTRCSCWSRPATRVWSSRPRLLARRGSTDGALQCGHRTGRHRPDLGRENGRCSGVTLVDRSTSTRRTARPRSRSRPG